MSGSLTHHTISGTHTREFISLFPTKELNFTLQNGIYLAKLAISNVILQPILYKMKLTATRYYHVNPIAGKLLPGEQVIIHIKMPYPENPEARVDDKFLIQAFVPRNHHILDDVQEVMEEFKHHMPPMDNVQQTKLKVYYDVPQHNSPSWKKLKSPHSRGSSVKQVTWKSDLEKEDAMMVRIRTASTDNSLKNEDNINSPVNSVLHLDNNRDNSLQIFTPQKQTEHKKASFELNNSSGSITFRRVNLKSGSKKKSIKDEITESMSRGMQRADMTEALIPSETRTSKVLVLEDNNQSLSNQNVSQGILSNVSAVTASRRGLILKQKCVQLESKYKTQQAELEALINEKEEYLNQLNKLKHIFGDVSFEDPELAKNPPSNKGNKMRFEVWQLMLVSVGCLILGSIIAS